MAVDLEKLVLQLSADIRSYENQLKRAEGVADRSARKIEQTLARTQRRIAAQMTSIGGALVPSLAGIAGALSVRQIVGYADAWVRAGNKIVASGSALETQAMMLRELADAAVDSRSEFEQTVRVFSRLQLGTENLNLSQRELLRLTTTINKAFRIGGSATSEAQAGTLQLVQALGSGFVQGDELRSIRENALVLAKAIAEEMGVGVGELKQLGAQGKLTSDIIIRAFKRIEDQVDSTFKTLKITAEEALTNLETRFTQFIGNFFQDSGLQQGVVGAIEFITKNIEPLSKALLVVAAVLTPVLIGALATATKAMFAFSAALVGSPIMLTAAALTGLAAAFVLFTGESYESQRRQREFNEVMAASNKFLEDAKDKTNDLTDAMKRSRLEDIEKITAQERLALAAANVNLQLAKQRALAASSPGSSALTRAPVFGERQGVINQMAAIKAGREGQAQSDLAAAERAVAEAEKRVMDISIAGFKIFNTPTKKLGSSGAPDGGAGSKDYARAKDQIEERTQAMLDQASAARRTTFELEKLEARSRLLAAAEDQGLKLTPQLTTEIDRLAEAYGKAAAKLEVAKKLAEVDDDIKRLEIEAGAAGMAASAAEAFRLKQELLNAALAAGEPVTDALRAKIELLASAYGDAFARAETANILAEAAKEVRNLELDARILAGTFGMTEEQAAAYRFEQELLNAVLEATGNITPEVALRIRELGAAYLKAGEDMKRLRENEAALNEFKGIVRDFAGDITNQLQGLGDGWENVIDRMERRLIEFITEQLVLAPFEQWVSGILQQLSRLDGAGGGGGGFGNIIGSIIGSIIGGGGGGAGSFIDAGTFINPGLAHRGGRVGGSLPSKAVDSRVFAGAPRLHAGGPVGNLAPGEVPIIAKRDEWVLTPGQMAALGGGKRVYVQVVQNIATDRVADFRAARAQLARDAAGGMRRAASRHG